MNPRILVISPSFEDWIINLLGFLKGWSTDANTFFISCISGYLKNEPEYNEFVLSQNWCFVPCDYSLPMDTNDCIPRIKYSDYYAKQHVIYKRFFPDLYLHTYQIIQSIICKINPDWIITCYGSLYIYNVLTSYFTRLLFPTEKVILYKDRPFADMRLYACNNANWLGIKEQKVKSCSSTIQQKLFLANKYFPELLIQYPNIYSYQEILYSNKILNNPCIFKE